MIDIYSRDDVRGNSDVCITKDTSIEFITITVIQVKNAHLVADSKV